MVRGQQYKYHVILLRPPNAGEHAHLNRQFRRQFRVRRRCLQQWLDFLSHNHPGYRDITVCQKRMSVLPEDGDVLDQVAIVEVSDPLAVPDLLPEDTEMEALHSHVLGDEHDAPPPARPATQHQLEMPDIRRTPINEFNQSQALLSLAFPTLFPRGQADFIEPRFACHPTFRFVVFNTLMRTAQLRGTRPYWYRKRRELESYAYNLRCPGAFITFSPADLHWRSLYQHLPQFQDWQELPEQQRMGIDIVLKQKFNVTDFWNRYEWQGRGKFARVWSFHVTAFNPEPARVQQQGEGNPWL
ncbi:ATP-dependent DNA helicase PIF1 [Hirsutella rhossiliensis]|uniref:ATP-dependent DNA helicase PIF1 n=1 Tax=Hirsutella rhossiliensis TaxID=111463 RepID=A0A9P8MML8_9HYPO|nr:ATP-dependent DNA helicase PIF1 [Hirsutella rhossiliensis]KAH0959008.1 ATP-dependent DNA helicase PIF1 [Hirsutella rhossiliensis]